MPGEKRGDDEYWKIQKIVYAKLQEESIRTKSRVNITNTLSRNVFTIGLDVRNENKYVFQKFCKNLLIL